MAGQRITLFVAGKEFKHTAENPQMERCMRKAADEVNKMLEELEISYQAVPFEDKLSLIALRQTVAKLVAQEELAGQRDELRSMDGALASYLKGVK